MNSTYSIVDLENEIIQALYQEKSYHLPPICESLGLSHGTADEAYSSKKCYVRNRLLGLGKDKLLAIGRMVFDRYKIPKIEEIITSLEHPFKKWGPTKNIIFAADGPKPEIVLSDAIENTIQIIKNEEFCLVFDEEIPPEGLSWDSLVKWYSKKNNYPYPDLETERQLYIRLDKSISSPPEKTFFKTYFEKFKNNSTQFFPALIPQVYLHFDPLILSSVGYEKRLFRQRMDFLLLFPRGNRIVIEIDGKQHYSKNDKPDPQLYSEMVSEDRKLKIYGYEIFRFGGFELSSSNSKHLIEDFFVQIFRKYEINKI